MLHVEQVDVEAHVLQLVTQAVHTLAPALDHLPEGHAVHPVEAVELVYLPAAHFVQTEAFSAEYVPLAQLKQLVGFEFATEYLPAAQFVQAVDFCLLVYVPPGQLGHPVDPSLGA